MSWQPIPQGTLLRGRYEVEALLGRGGFGATYRALDRERFDRPCAIKELLPIQAENPKVRELFEREARTLLVLKHPGVPALHAYLVEKDRYYLVQDFIPGVTLAEELTRRGPFREAEVVGVLEETLAILDYLHSRDPAVIHRDVKPANLIRSNAGRLYLIDFGAVKEAVGLTSLSAESTIIGTSGYTPPEQLRGVVSPASDLYALGATALHLLSGRPPGEWYDVVEGRWRFEGRLGIGPGLERVLQGLLEEQVARRFQSAGDVTHRLHALAGIGVLGSAPTTVEAERSAHVTTEQRKAPAGAARAQTFENVWYRAREKKLTEIWPFEDVGELIVREDSLEFQGSKQRVVITRVRRVSLVRWVTDILNQWVKVEYGEGAALTTAFFMEGSWVGLGGMLGGTRRILEAVQRLVE